MTTALEVRNLSVEITRHGDTIRPVDDVSFSVDAGDCLGLVGESGAGKSMTLKAILGLLPKGARVTSGELLLRTSEDSLASIDPISVRGHGISMVFQEPMTALNPTRRVVDIIADGARAHRDMSKAEAQETAVRLLGEVGVPAPERRARAWPHQLSGGLRQRVMIAMALATEPEVLLCDEPTTALDVTVQDQILGLLDRIRRERGLSIIFVTHDLAVIGQVAQQVAVMYAGRVVETGPVRPVLDRSLHPYTNALVTSIPHVYTGTDQRLRTIEGAPPDPESFPSGCRFSPRCPFAQPDCTRAEHVLVEQTPDHRTACIHPGALTSATMEGSP
jgi:oligopeptide/dipeptide ABC transporter ATP-binding protein